MELLSRNASWKVKGYSHFKAARAGPRRDAGMESGAISTGSFAPFRVIPVKATYLPA
jgi:hypothetical protein